MDKFAHDFDSAMHHLKSVVTASDSGDALRRLILAGKFIDHCIDDLNNQGK